MKKNKFINPHALDLHRGFKDVILWMIGYYDAPSPTPTAPSSFRYPLANLNCDPSLPKVTWINHSSFLIQCEGVNILTDPIWSKRCSPVSFIGPKRQHSPGILLSKLPRIDYVLISHDHYDHLDKKSVIALSRLFPGIVWLVPKGVKKWFDRWKISSVFELNWWDEKSITPSFVQNMQIKITSVPSQHFSGRKLSDRNTTLWCGWVVEFFRNNQLFKRFYFVGDTGYNSVDFKKIGEKFQFMDLSLIPIGSYRPEAFMGPVHVNPEESVRIHREVGSKLSVGMHWKTFRLSSEPVDQPPFDLLFYLKREGIDPHSFLAIDPGYAINW